MSVAEAGAAGARGTLPNRAARSGGKNWSEPSKSASRVRGGVRHSVKIRGRARRGKWLDREEGGRESRDRKIVMGAPTGAGPTILAAGPGPCRRLAGPARD
ncbi:hypothetical protein MTO96_031242 [Rhipicephalus appendiculatus]